MLVFCGTNLIVGILWPESYWSANKNLKDSKKWLAENTNIPRPSDLVRTYRHLFKENDCPKYQDSTPVKFSPKVSTRFPKSFLMQYDLLMFLKMFMIFQMSRIHQDSTTDKFFENARRYQLFWTHQISKTKQSVPHFWCPTGSGILFFVGVPVCWDMKK